MKVLTGARAIFSAAHRSLDGVMHGHTWRVVAWWEGFPDATVKQAELIKYLTVFDHTVLLENQSWAEYLAQSIMVGMQCARVEVSRPLEGLYAVVEAE